MSRAGERRIVGVRRRLASACAFALLAALAAVSTAATPAGLSATRVWPGPDYTRVTLESPGSIAFKVFSVADPPRLVLDLERVEPDAVLDALPGRFSPDDRFVQAVRIGRFKPGVVRVVFDLKAAVEPQAFLLSPVGEYGYRLVVDMYPAAASDPVLGLLEEIGRDRPGPAGSPAPATAESGTPAADTATVVAAKATPEDAAKRAAKEARASAGSPRPVVVAIDAGHGGEDPGAKGGKGTLEKDVTLSIARRLKALVDAEPGMRAVLVRDGDYFIPLHHRVAKARAAEPDVFVSIHADAFIKPHARGSSVFALSENGATSAAARWLAKRENDADLIGGINIDVADPYLKRVLLDLSQTATINDSLKLGSSVLQELEGVNTLHKNHVEQAGFAVLKAPDIPSILVETAFISNPEEEKRLADAEYQTRLASAILAGIKRYIAQAPPAARVQRATAPGVATAPTSKAQAAAAQTGSAVQTKASGAVAGGTAKAGGATATAGKQQRASTVTAALECAAGASGPKREATTCTSTKGSGRRVPARD
jgi:N-acetylmuramoyl-L-alanine amidase